jgi:acetone carboxylase, alpha subunit
MIEDDLNEGHLLPRFAEKVYGAIVSQDEKGRYIVDEEATAKRREEIRKERLKRGVPTKQWMEKEREKIINKEASVQVRHMYASSFALSEKFYNEFKAFWNLPEDWILTEDELGVPVFGRKINKLG